MRTQCFAEPPVRGNEERNGDRAWANNVAIVLTDGASNVNEAQTIPMANRAKRNNIRIITVGITDQVNYPELLGIASGPRDVINVTDFNQLQTILRQLVELTCETERPIRNLYYIINNFPSLLCIVTKIVPFKKLYICFATRISKSLSIIFYLACSILVTNTVIMPLMLLCLAKETLCLKHYYTDNNKTINITINYFIYDF